jgi:uncharacterized membrane-anchored protein
MKYRSLAFGLAILLQSGLLLSIPLRGLPTRIWGKSVVLETIPVSFNRLSDQPTHLRYRIAQRAKLRDLPGGQATFGPKPKLATDFFVILEPTQANRPWKVVQVSRDRPKQLTAKQVILQGEDNGNDWVRYGMEQYRLPPQIRQRFNPAEGSVHYPALNVEVKTDPLGQGLPIALWVGGARYRF